MPAIMTTAKDIQRLEAELATFIRAEDPDAVRRVYRELLTAGKSRHEVMAEMIRASTELQVSAASPQGAQPNGSSKPQRETEPNIAERIGARRLPDSSAVPDHPPVTCHAAEQIPSVAATDAVHSEVAPRGDSRFGPGRGILFSRFSWWSGLSLAFYCREPFRKNQPQVG